VNRHRTLRHLVYSPSTLPCRREGGEERRGRRGPGCVHVAGSAQCMLRVMGTHTTLHYVHTALRLNMLLFLLISPLVPSCPSVSVSLAARCSFTYCVPALRHRCVSVCVGSRPCVCAYTRTVPPGSICSVARVSRRSGCMLHESQSRQSFRLVHAPAGTSARAQQHTYLSDFLQCMWYV
jgi:hypothetical protein